ncbi:MAG: hypothetical protein UFE80_02475 [Christensenellales bacterium]|uniref:Uncharacterized protein n=1 Tax=Candidatus Avichristensenella intestinipullorum TaxID=2840693 RepID=A0A9D0YUP7_9FIRM|nr:hypothetical protein [Christensenellales bacterium]HIQ62414.1 hypothetical protein [Candidatus Avichristensenella intestinipullorum]
MRKKRIFAALMALWLCCLSSAALAAAFPDLACFLNEPCRLYRERYQFSQDFLCDAYVWEYPAGWDTDNDVAFALLAQWSHGWAWERGTVEGYDAILLTDHTGAQGYLISGFDGHILLLVPVGCEIEPLALANDEVQTAAPDTNVPAAQTQQETGGGHWEWQEVTVDCPACVGGVCSVCNGSGFYRLYGERVLCRIYCSSCDGLGTFTQRQYVFVSDE